MKMLKFGISLNYLEEVQFRLVDDAFTKIQFQNIANVIEIKNYSLTWPTFRGSSFPRV